MGTEKFEKHLSMIGSDHRQFPPSVPQTETQISIFAMSFSHIPSRSPAELPSSEAPLEAPKPDSPTNAHDEVQFSQGADFPLPPDPNEDPDHEDQDGDDVPNFLSYFTLVPVCPIVGSEHKQVLVELALPLE